jgi:hypothetical protein
MHSGAGFLKDLGEHPLKAAAWILLPFAFLTHVGNACAQATGVVVAAPTTRTSGTGDQVSDKPHVAKVHPAVIRSMADLSRYLEEHRSSPFDAFSKRALDLFIASLTFNDFGLTGFRTTEVESELTPGEALAILSLFGVETTISSLQFEHRDDEDREPPEPTPTKGILFDVVHQVRTLNHEIDDPDRKLARMEEVFANVLDLVDGTQIENLSDPDVEDFFEASMLLAGYSNAPNHVRQMRHAYNELERRGSSSRGQGKRMRDQYVAARMIEDAIAFAFERPDLDLKRIPRFVEPASPQSRPRLWQLAANGSSLESHTFQMDRDAAVVVVASPWCSFSNAASIAIANDSELSMLMAQHSTWVLAQMSVPDFEDIRKWNETFPGRPLQMVDRNADWPDINLWETPVFYFYRDGGIVSTVTGWPDATQLERLREGFSSLGLTSGRPGSSAR